MSQLRRRPTASARNEKDFEETGRQSLFSCGLAVAHSLVSCGLAVAHNFGQRPEVEVIKLNSAKIYRFLQLLSHSRGFFARV
jgi:hypothetical protein